MLLQLRIFSSILIKDIRQLLTKSGRGSDTQPLMEGTSMFQHVVYKELHPGTASRQLFRHHGDDVAQDSCQPGLCPVQCSPAFALPARLSRRDL